LGKEGQIRAKPMEFNDYVAKLKNEAADPDCNKIMLAGKIHQDVKNNRSRLSNSQIKELAAIQRSLGVPK